jgi:hypothetical protein
MRRRRHPSQPIEREPDPHEGLLYHPTQGWVTPERMTYICQSNIIAMELHPALEWLREEDRREMERPDG